MPAGWNEQDTLHLIVLPIPDDTTGKDSPDMAQLLAIYGSARVRTPFALRGGGEMGGRLWQEIIAFHKELNAVADGEIDELDPARLREGGKAMFDMLFQKEVRRLYDQAKSRDIKRRINIVFTSMISWVADLPWELAYDPSCKSFLAMSDVRFVRNVLTPVPADRIDPEQRPLRILLVSAAPIGTVPLAEDEERKLILRAFQPLMRRGLVEVYPLLRATPQALHQHVERYDFDVVHFIGHGEFDSDAQTGYLLFEDVDGKRARINTESLKGILRARGIRLMFLNACQSAQGGRADYNKGVAPGLVADGVPAVVANQYTVLDHSATMFAMEFYTRLVRGQSLGDAMRETRIAINYLIGEGMDWAVPVLFARDPNAQLCTALAGSDDIPPPEVAPSGDGPSSASGDGGGDEEQLASGNRSEDESGTTLGSAGVRSSARQFTTNALRVALWDVTDSIPMLETVAAQMNAAQNQFIFEVANLTAPLGTFTTRKSASSGEVRKRVSYLSAERVARKMRNTVSSLGVELLICVTDQPLRDGETLNLYLWTDDHASGPKSSGAGRIAVYSTWGFDKPITGNLVQRALANISVQSIVSLLSDAYPDRPEKGSIAYDNNERDIEGVVGRLVIDKRHFDLLKDSGLSAAVLESMQRLLDLFQPTSTVEGAGPKSVTAAKLERGAQDKSRRPSVAKKSKSSRRARSK